MWRAGNPGAEDSGLRRRQQSLCEPSLLRPGAHAQLGCPRPALAPRDTGSEPGARDEAGKAARMRRPAAPAPQDGEAKVEFSSGNLTR